MERSLQGAIATGSLIRLERMAVVFLDVRQKDRFELGHQLPIFLGQGTEPPVQLKFFDVLLIAVSSIFICFAATLYPASKAAKSDPIEAIRYG